MSYIGWRAKLDDLEVGEVITVPPIGGKPQNSVRSAMSHYHSQPGSEKRYASSLLVDRSIKVWRVS